MSEVAFFDVRPEDNVIDFLCVPFFSLSRSVWLADEKCSGAWNVYPYFKSGYLLINSIERGAFVVKRQ